MDGWMVDEGMVLGGMDGWLDGWRHEEELCPLSVANFNSKGAPCRRHLQGD